MEDLSDGCKVRISKYLEEEVYIEQPPGYMKKGHEDKVYRLKKAFYGLKQAPRAWNTRIDEYFQKNEIMKSPYEHALYSKINKVGDIMIVCLYVDDMIFIGNNPVKQMEDGIVVSQKKYAEEILKKVQNATL